MKLIINKCNPVLTHKLIYFALIIKSDIYMPHNCEKLQKILDTCKKNVFREPKNNDPTYLAKMYTCVLLVEEINKKCK